MSADQKTTNVNAQFEADMPFLRLRICQTDVIKAAKRFDACMTEFAGDLAACHEYQGALFSAVERLRREEDAINARVN
ncbi:hypothetical protein [Limobrevibacterium gyesilva]|uniref:Uncharacterized protein n=1 Tax=Limobrevibacterium gyesilva TaxID=2991712 RepID=A0AA42CJZ5_9PROT|nr:hypothetical protein [Limobrevibacterium gyesilva]MCW3477392.1 hypothetical protein [Limobrevibacterium gyesilva]